MKKLLAILLALVMVFSLSACGGGSDNKNNIIGVWHVVDEETETDYGLGIEFTADEKVRYGLTEDVFTAIADGNEEDAETAMKAMDFLATIEYKVVSDTRIELTAKALMGFGGKETETVEYSIDGDNLTFDGVAFTRVKEEK